GLTGIRRRNQPVRLDCGFDGPRVTVPNDLEQLTRPVHFALHPADCARRNVAFDTQDTRVSGDLVSAELRLHYMAALAAELGFLHVLHSVVGKLRHDQDVHDCRNRQENAQALERILTREHRSAAFSNSATRKPYADRDQDKTKYENERENEKSDYSDVGI